MPSDKDLSIGAVGGGQQGVPSGAVYAGGLPMGSTISKKPCYLMVIDGVGKSNKTVKHFVTVDKPDIQQAFVQVKGFFCEEDEETIVASFGEIVAATAKESIMDVMFPATKIHYIRSLVFNANKPKNIVR